MSTKKRVLVLLVVILAMIGVHRLLFTCECVNYEGSENCAENSCAVNCQYHGGCFGITGPWTCQDDLLLWQISCSDGYQWFEWCACH